MAKSLVETKVTMDDRALYKTLCHDLRRQIISRQVQPGDKLPSITALCQQYGVSSITVRAAVRELVGEGLLESRPRSGLYVRDHITSRPVGILANTVAILTTMANFLEEQRQGGWLHHITLGAQSAVREAGLHAMVLHHDRLVGEELEMFAASNPRVVVLTDRAHGYEYPQVMRLIDDLNRRDVRLTLYGSSPQWSKHDRVVSDHEDGAYQSARWLLEQGCRRILYIWPMDHSGYWYPARYEGYRKALTEQGLEPEPALPIIEENESFSSYPEREVRRLAGYLLEYLSGPNRADGLMVHVDSDYFLVAAACRLFGLEPGRDVLLTEGRKWEHSAPQVTVDKRNRQLGMELVKLLLQRENGELPPQPQCRSIKPKLVPISPRQALVADDLASEEDAREMMYPPLPANR
jgi:GntR family transcriptional regulator